MEWLNYHHLFYFWTVVRTGSITKACEELRLAPPTVSAQLKSFEDQLGEKLLKRSGRNLVPTEIGLAVYRQAEEIFSIGREIMDTVKQRPTHRPLRLVVWMALYRRRLHTGSLSRHYDWRCRCGWCVTKRTWNAWLRNWRCTRSTWC